ncbi:MAG: glycosyltransferase [Lachnospiraceae bacterium]|nr:glycosyltransferase [Lachnospiraceae bacterium]
MISIIVPVYNVEKYLSRCIDSILEQTYHELEIILVDDGSKDCSGRICDAYARKDPRIKVVHKENGGLVNARQAGVSIASGEYVGFADPDDWMEKEMYQTLYNAVVQENADVVVEGKKEDYDGECFSVLNSIPTGCYSTTEQRKYLLGNMISCSDFFCLGIQPYLWNKLFRREQIMEHIDKVPPLIRVGEDATISYPVLSAAKCVVVLDTAHYHYCHHQDSMMSGYGTVEQEYDNAILLHDFLKRSFMQQSIYTDMERQLLRYTINNLLARSYGKFAGVDKESILFPYPDIVSGDTVVIYGAGALGKAVYRYAESCTGLKVKAFVDQNASCYQRADVNVDMLENVVIEDKDKILVTVFNEVAYHAIWENLIRTGIKSRQIFWLDTEKLEKYFNESDVGWDAGQI